jgi:hypothetical protein
MVFCDCCGWEDRGEVHPASFLRFDERRDVQVTCPCCGLLDITIARRIPTSRTVERRQLAGRTPLRGTPRHCPRASRHQGLAQRVFAADDVAAIFGTDV